MGRSWELGAVAVAGKVEPVLICDRDRKWSRGVLEFREHEGVRIIRTPFRAPNCNAYAERFVRSIKEECLARVIPLGERHLRRLIAEFCSPLPRRAESSRHRNELIQPLGRVDGQGRVRRHQRIGGVLSYYYVPRSVHRTTTQ